MSDFHFGITPNHENRLEVMKKFFSRRISDVSWTPAIADPRLIFKPTTYSDYVPLRLAKFCEKRQNDFDVAVITGDLASTGQRDDLEAAGSYVLKSRGKVFQTDHESTLGGLSRRVCLIPGNHDRYESNLPTPGSRVFDDVFKEIYPGSDVHVLTISKSGKRVGIILADFCIRKAEDVASVKRPVNSVKSLYGSGVVYDDISGNMINYTQDLRRKNPGIFVIWAIHFAPFDCGEELKLHHFHSITKAAKNNNIQLMLCGHTHDEIKHNDGNLVVYCSGSAMCVDREDQHTAHIIDIRFDKNETTIKRENYFLKRESREFKLSRVD